MDISALKGLAMQIALSLLLLNNYETVAYHDDTHNVAKRLDVDVCTGSLLIQLKPLATPTIPLSTSLGVQVADVE